MAIIQKSQEENWYIFVNKEAIEILLIGDILCFYRPSLFAINRSEIFERGY